VRAEARWRLVVTAGLVCILCNAGEHMLKPRAHPNWDGAEDAPEGRDWAPKDLCACECAQEPVQKRIVTLHLPPVP
jgi:hypothetical protein